jgi:hypothetical protein
MIVKRIRYKLVILATDRIASMVSLLTPGPVVSSEDFTLPISVFSRISARGRE